MFDEKAFAENMVKQGKELISAEFSQKEKDYISETMGNFVLLAGEALNNDKESKFSD